MLGWHLNNGAGKPSDYLASEHSAFIMERMQRFDSDLVKHTKRSTRLMSENIELRNQVHKLEMQMSTAERRLIDKEAVRVTKKHEKVIDELD